MRMVRFVEGADGGDGVHEGRNGGGGWCGEV